ncbi:Alpha/Beta hydrolase protein [Pavlovales sp. CCMP2436]|nr:Alpha/Beta hydrolase protein [Pavlovales sp. CCMP2436]
MGCSDAVLASSNAPFQTAVGRRAAFPPEAPHPEPTRALNSAAPMKLGPETSGYFALADGRQLYWRKLMPQGTPKATMMFFHGYGDHSSFHLVQTAREYVSALGVVALLVDQPNHGMSDGVQALIRSWAEHLDAMEEFCDGPGEAAREAPDGKKLQIFAYGASMGGALLIDLCLRKPDRFSGVILTAPMVRIKAETRPKPVVESFLRHVICRIPLVRDMALVPNDNFFEAIYSENWRLEEHRGNALNYSGPTRLITGLNLIDASDGIAARMEELQTPFLVIHGTADVTTDSSLSVELHQRAGASDKTLELVEGARHGIDFGEVPEIHARVYATKFAWIKLRLKPPA